MITRAIGLLLAICGSLLIVSAVFAIDPRFIIGTLLILVGYSICQFRS